MQKYLSLLLITFIFVACGSNNKQESQIDQRLTAIAELIAQNKLDEAKAEIDSIHKNFPRKIDKRRIAAALSDSITRIESRTTLELFSTHMPLLINRADSLRKNFKYEKEEKYQDFGNFVYKTQITEQNMTRNYLKSFIDEQSNIFIVSNLVGQRINQSIIKLSVADVFVTTDTTNNRKGVFHSFSNEGQYWETLTFKNDDILTLAAFVEQNAKQKIKVELKGTKNFNYQLAESDKKAIVETYKLWNTMREIKILEFEVEKANARILKINQREALNKNK